MLSLADKLVVAGAIAKESSSIRVIEAGSEDLSCRRAKKKKEETQVSRAEGRETL
jgi:hypothetical protein